MTPCREWQAAKATNGYGIKWDKVLKKDVRIHRWVVAQIHGWEAIEGKVVMHLCDNKACYRYDHLRIGTVADNAADMAAKKRGNNQYKAKTHCKNNHEYTDANTRIRIRDGREVRVCRECERIRQSSRRAKK